MDDKLIKYVENNIFPIYDKSNKAHDIGHNIDAENHEIVSAQIFSENKDIKSFFAFEELIIIKEAIGDHRASLEHDPRSICGKLLSSADININVDMPLRRTYLYGLKQYPDLTLEQHIERSYQHIKEKFVANGYAKMYIQDEIYISYLKDVDELLENRDSFTKRFKKINSIKE